LLLQYLLIESKYWDGGFFGRAMEVYRELRNAKITPVMGGFERRGLKAITRIWNVSTLIIQVPMNRVRTTLQRQCHLWCCTYPVHGLNVNDECRESPNPQSSLSTPDFDQLVRPKFRQMNVLLVRVLQTVKVRVLQTVNNS
jgi:hypothetical protein